MRAGRVRAGWVVAAAMLIGCCAGVLPAAWAQSAPEPAHNASSNASDMGAAIANVLADPEVARAHWGISVTTMEGQPVYTLNDGQFFQPASNAKLFTTAAALALLGPGYQAKTYLIESGPVGADGRLNGDLRLVGAADPALSNRSYPYTVASDSQRLDTMPVAFDEFAGALAQSGVTGISGNLVADDSFFPLERYGTGWSWEDLQWEYGAPVSALTVNDNTMFLNLQPGAAADEPVQAVWAIPDAAYKLDASGLTTAMRGTKRALGVEHQPGSMEFRVFGQLPALGQVAGHSAGHAGVPGQVASQNSATGWQPAKARSRVSSRPGGGAAEGVVPVALAVEEPASYAAELLRQALASRGVALQGTVLTRHRDNVDTQGFRDEIRQPLEFKPQADALAALVPMLAATDKITAAHTGPPLLQEVTLTNKVSQNLHAELLLRLLGRAYGEDGSIAQGARVVRQFAVNAGVGGDDFVFFDGSGLSNDDMVAPRAVTALLRYAAAQPWGEGYRDSLPVGGVDGTLSERFTTPELKGKIFAKTGTLSEARALSGYMIAASGRTLVFSILASAHMPGTGAERVAMDKIVALIAAAN